MIRRTWPAALLLLLLGTVCPAAQDSQWYALFLQDQRAGWAHDRRVEADGLITSTQTVQVQIRRGPVTLSIRFEEQFVETEAGKPVRAVVTQSLGAQTSTQVMTFDEEGITLNVQQGEQVQERRFPLPDKPWLPPAAAQRYFEQQTQAGRDEVRYWTVQPSVGPTAHELVMKRVGEEQIEVLGRIVPAVAWDSTHTAMPNVVSRSYLDEQGTALKSTVPLPGLSMTMIATDEQLAKAEVDPPELLMSSLIHPDRPIPRARTLRKAVFELSLADGEAMPALPHTPAQRVEQLDGGRVRVTVDADGPFGVGIDDQPTDANRESSSMIGVDDPKVRELLAKALDGVPKDASPADKAGAIRRFVSRHVQAKDLSVGLASAGEVARTGQGDCTEHAVLLAALLRGAGIPSRTVSGLMYVDHMLDRQSLFGYHMWTQAWIDGRWVDLDAILDGQRDFDATHIALSTSAMSDGQTFNDMVTFMPVFGRLQIRVIESE